MKKFTVIAIISIMAFQFYCLPVRSEEIPNAIIIHLGKDLLDADLRLHSTKTKEANLYDFLKDYRDQIVPAIIARDPRDIVAENLARAVAQCSEPRDYLIMVTQFLNEVANGNFDVTKDKWIVYSMLGFNDEDTAGLIPMNYEIPELNEALRRAAPKLNTGDQEWIDAVLSGDQRKETIEFCSGQGFPLPVTYSSLYPKGKTATSPGQVLKGLPEAEVHGSQTSSPNKDATGGRAKAKPFWWIFASVGAVVAFLLLAKRKKKSSSH